MLIYLLLGFAMALDSFNWVVLNDTVMGGRSTAIVQQQSSDLVFQGTVSLENNGGFASIRTESVVDLSRNTAVEIRLSGTKVPVQFVVWMGQGANLYYAMDMTVQSENQILEFSDFTAKSYGRVVAAPSLNRQDRSNVTIGILVGDGYEGTFDLRLEHLNFIGEVANVPTQFKEQYAVKIAQVLQRAIQRGVPVYNAGDPAQCAAIYQTALEDLLVLAADGLPEDVTANIEQTLESSSSMSYNDKAWAYRRMMDSILMML